MVFSAFLVGLLALPSLGSAKNLQAQIVAESLGVKSVGLLPTSPIYFLKEAGRGIQSFFTFNPVQKAELKLKVADEKLVEAKAVSENDPQNETAIKKAFDNYQGQVIDLNKNLESLKTSSQNPNVQTLFQKVAERSVEHQQIFEAFPIQQTIKDGLGKVISMLNVPSIKVLSPNGGETWEMGKEYEIKWQSSGVNKVFINLMVPIKTLNKPAHYASICGFPPQPASSGSYKLEISSCGNIVPADRPPGIKPGQYKILLGGDGDDNYVPAKVLDESDAPFSIVSSGQAQTSFKGLLEVSGPTIQAWGTHTLRDTSYEKPVVYRIKAANDKVLEELKKYEGQKVTIKGTATYMNLEGGFWGIVAEEVVVPEVGSTQISTNNWLSYYDEEFSGFQFKYPNGWKVTKAYYQTPGEQGAGIKPSVIGLGIVPVGESDDLHGDPSNLPKGIAIGGRQIGCDNAQASRCLTVYNVPVYTRNTDSETIKIFNSFVATIIKKPVDIKISSPAHNVIWDTGKTYKVEWKYIKEQTNSSNLVSLTLINTNEEGLSQTFWQADVKDTGSYEIKIPYGKSATAVQEKFGPYYFEIHANPKSVTFPSGGGGVRYDTGWSDLFYINSQTGEPNFPAIPRG